MRGNDLANIAFKATAVHKWEDKHNSISELHLTVLEADEDDEGKEIPNGVILTDAEFRSGLGRDMLTIVSKAQWEQLKVLVDAAFMQEANIEKQKVEDDE